MGGPTTAELIVLDEEEEWFGPVYCCGSCDEHFMTLSEPQPKFCPKCGAKFVE
jgi:hypothetical protein